MIKQTLVRMLTYLRKYCQNNTIERHAEVGPVHLWRMKRDFQISFLMEAGLQPEHYLLDLGCGTLRGGIPLIDYLYPGHYYGVEVRQELLADAKQEIRDYRLEHKQPILLSSEQFEAKIADVHFEFVWAFSVLIHMTDRVLLKTLNQVCRSLHQSGAFFANVNIGERANDGSWKEFPVVYRNLAFYKEMAQRAQLCVQDMGTLHSLGHYSGVPDQDRQHMLRFCNLATSANAFVL